MTFSNIGNSELISTVNNRLVLETVRLMQPTFRAEVARRTGLKPATVTGILNHLVEQNLVKTVVAPSDSRNGSIAAGRPPLMVEINGDAKRILAIDLEPDRIRLATTDLLTRILDFRQQEIDRFDKPENTIAKIVKFGHELLKMIPRRLLLGVGVSLPGLIDQPTGMLLSSTNMPAWNNVPIGPILKRELRVPVRVERSIRLAALYEKWTRPEHQNRSVAVISLRTGIGMSLLQNGQVYSGSRGLGGEIGHMLIDIDGKPCECGSRGCLETFVSASAICQRAKSMIASGRGQAIAKAIEGGEVLVPELIYRLAKEGDRDCGEIVVEVGRYIGIAIANIINLLAPDEVVICGAIDVVENLLLPAIQRQIDTSALPRSRENVTLSIGREHEKMPLLGASVLICQDVFDLPEIRRAGIHAKKSRTGAF